MTVAAGMAGQTQEGVRLSVGFLALVVLGMAALVALGIWQLERREWKLALIERVEQRVHAEPIPAPKRAVTAAQDEYRHVRLEGRYLDSAATLVLAVGPRFYAMAIAKKRSSAASPTPPTTAWNCAPLSKASAR